MKISARTFAASSACVGLLFGCATAQDHEKEVAVKPAVMKAFLADKPTPTRRLYENVLSQGERNLVLNYLRAGLAALELGALDTAQKSFDVAVDRIDSIYANNPKAKEARSKFIKENIKDYKGEAYKRAMAFYYRGIVYLMNGDYGNAQASFGDGLLQDSFAEDKDDYAQDFAMLAFLRGWAYRCQGSQVSASTYFTEAQKLHNKQIHETPRPSKVVDSALEPPEDGDNVLLVGESGSAPRKMATGEYKEKLTYRRGPQQPVARIAFETAGSRTVALPFEDIFWQAETRGDRGAIDYIMEGKAHFKKTTNTVGDVMLTAGAATAIYGGYGGNRNAALAGGIMMLGGLIAKGISAATRPEADLRQWDNLPEDIYLATAKMNPGTHEAKVVFLDANGDPVGIPPKVAKVTFAGSCGIAWARSKSALDVPDDAPESVVPGYIVTDASKSKIKTEGASE